MKTVIDFFGCSFTQFAQYPYSIPSDKFDIGLYSFHSHNTKPLSSFLDFDLAYNSNENYEVNNYGRGSFGNFTICNVLENKTKKLNKENNNVAVVQLSAILRNEQSWETIKQENKYYIKTDDVFTIDFDRVKPDYICDVMNINKFYSNHFSNLEKMIHLLEQNYTKFIIFFGWDVATIDFLKIFENWKYKNLINSYEYEYKLDSSQYFENNLNYDTNTKLYKGVLGGLLDYGSNKLEEQFRYVGGRVNDHHPSYFTNKIFYSDVIRNFVSNSTNLNFDKLYFTEKEVIEFEEFLKELLVKKAKGNEWENYEYHDLQKETIMYIRKHILNNKTI